MWIVSRCPKNSTTTRFAAGPIVFRLVTRDERSLRSQVDAEHLEPPVPGTLRRVRFDVWQQRWHAGDARAASPLPRELPHASQTSRAGTGLAAPEREISCRV